jgi:DNA-binding PadR family transcriptional regulator
MVLHEPTFFILTALVRMPLHGYGIMQAVAELSQGRINLRAGTLYAALDRLADEGLIVTDREEAVDGRLRRYYRLTDDGTGALEAEVKRLRSNASVAAAQLRQAYGGASYA